MRIAIITMLSLAACSSGSSDLLKDGPTTGTPCSGGSPTMLSAVPAGDASKYTSAYVDLDGDDIEVLLVPSGGSLDLTTCMFGWSGGGPEGVWKLNVEVQKLGTYTVDSGDVSLFPSVNDPATSGSVTLAGYDAGIGQLCGSVDLTTQTGARLRGTFSGDVFCE